MSGVWKIEDDYELVSMCGISWHRNWNKNTCLAAKAATLLDLSETVEINMRGNVKGKITINEDCRKPWEMVSADSLKVSQLEGDVGTIFSRIIEIESKSKIDFEHVHVCFISAYNVTLSIPL